MNESSSAVAPPRSAEDRWSSTLDALELAIAHQRGALGNGDHTDAAAIAALAFDPPADLPPLPAALEKRAVRLLAQTSDLIEKAQTVADRLQPVGPVVHQPLARRVTATFDRRM